MRGWKGFWGAPWAFIVLVGVGAFLRLVRLNEIPPALFRDEAEKAYTAYSLLLTGRDLWGNFLPLFINVFGVTTSAIYQYAAIPFVWALGLNEWSARLPAACVGIATVIANYFFMRREYGKQSALWATLFLALSPWHIPFSRWAQQGIFLPLLLVCGLWSWQSFVRGKARWLCVSAACFALAVYAYDVARLFVPLLLLWMAILYRSELVKRWRATLAAALVFALLLSPVAYLVLWRTSAAQARFQAISIFGEASPLAIAKAFALNYLSHFSPSFLLLHGDAELRHSAGVGILSAAELAGLLLGIGFLVKGRGRRAWLWLGWLLLFPVAASLTKVGVPHALRTIVGIPALQDVAGLGVASLAARLGAPRQKTFQQACVLATVLAFIPFGFRYFGSYPKQSAFNWQYGVKQSLELLQPHMDKVDRVVFYNFTGAEYLVSFYAKLPPGQFQADGLRGTKYEIAPFNYPLERLYATAPGAAIAYVTLWGYPPPPEARVIPLGLDKEPVAALFLNRELARRITPKENVTHGR